MTQMMSTDESMTYTDMPQTLFGAIGFSHVFSGIALF